MKLKSLKVLGILAASFMVAGFAQAQDKALLNTLVQKGYLTQAEADQIAANTVAVKPASSATKSITFNGLIHSQFNWVTASDKTAGLPNPAGTTTFQMRRIYLGATAELGNGWSGTINTDFGAATVPGGATRNYLDKAFIAKQVDWDLLQGALNFGYRKVNFGYEENTSAADILTVERSIATWYWNMDGAAPGNLNFGARHVGIYWDGKVDQVDGLYYGFALTNQVQNAIGGQAGATDNDIAVWANIGYTAAWEDLTFDVGFNFGYKPGGNPAGAVVGTQAEVIGYNPYINLNWQGFSLMAELLASEVRDGRPVIGPGPQSSARPLGVNIIPSYRINEEWEVVFRWSHLYTNGRGLGAGNVLNGAPNPVDGRGFNRADSYYFGGNWYIQGNDVKLSAGYELTQFQDTPANGGANNARYNVNSFTTRLQLLF
jgi:hypothetical protein